MMGSTSGFFLTTMVSSLPYRLIFLYPFTAALRGVIPIEETVSIDLLSVNGLVRVATATSRGPIDILWRFYGESIDVIDVTDSSQQTGAGWTGYGRVPLERHHPLFGCRRRNIIAITRR